MQRPVQPFDPRHGLRQPAWWAALALLVFNDHVLKGSHLLPGALTGKLSDFAGLVVAPVLAVAISGARTRGARLALFALVALVFTLIKTSLAMSDLYVRALGALGVTARNVCDVTDLVALAILPFAWSLTTARTLRRERGQWGVRSWRDRLAFALGGVACMATSQPNPPGTAAWNTDAFVVNRTGAPIDLRIRWVSAAMDCTRVARDPAAILRREMFSAQPVTFRIDPSETFPLDRIAAAMAGAGVGTPPQTTGRLCDAVLLQADGLPTTAVFWQGGTVQNVPVTLAEGESTSALAVTLETRDAELRASATRSNIRAFTLATDARVCATPATRYEVGEDLFSNGVITGAGRLTVSAIDRLPDGCTRIEGDDQQGNTRRVYVCVPPEAVPFAVGEVLNIDRGQIYSGRVYTFDSGRRRLRVFSSAVWSSRAMFDNLAIAFGASPTCGTHATCGAYAERYDLAIEGVSAPLRAGMSVSVGRSTVYLGRAERVAVAPDVCTNEYRETGAIADLAIVTELQ
jgi:hypothetical protein